MVVPSTIVRTLALLSTRSVVVARKHAFPSTFPAVPALFTCPIQRAFSSTPLTMGINDFADKTDGAYKRQVSSFRDHIEPNGKFPPEKGELPLYLRSANSLTSGRYHLFVSYACPWAHRTLITRKLKGLDEFIGEQLADRCF